MAHAMAGSLRSACHVLGFDAAAAALRPLAPEPRATHPGAMSLNELLARLEELEAQTQGQADQARVRRARELVEEQLWP